MAFYFFTLDWGHHLHPEKKCFSPPAPLRKGRKKAHLPIHLALMLYTFLYIIFKPLV